MILVLAEILLTSLVLLLATAPAVPQTGSVSGRVLDAGLKIGFETYWTGAQLLERYPYRSGSPGTV